MSLPFGSSLQTRRSKTILSPEGTTAKFLYTILKQLDLKTVDWNEVAAQLDISNGHAARMRYSRFKTQIEGLAKENKAKIRADLRENLKKKEKRRWERVEEQSEQDYDGEQIKDEEREYRKKIKAGDPNIYSFVPSSSIVKTEKDISRPNTTVVSFKTEKGIGEARIHHPSLTTVSRHDQAGQTMSNQFRDTFQQATVQPNQQSYTHPWAAAGAFGWGRNARPPPQQTFGRYPDYTNPHSHCFPTRATHPQLMYGNADVYANKWYTAFPPAQQATSVYPPLNNVPNYELTAPSPALRQYDLTDLSRSTQALNNDVPATSSTNSDTISEPVIDLAEFAAEYGDWNPSDRAGVAVALDELKDHKDEAMSAQSLVHHSLPTDTDLEETAVKNADASSDPTQRNPPGKDLTAEATNQVQESICTTNTDTAIRVEASTDAESKLVENTSSTETSAEEIIVKTEPPIEII